MGLWNLTFTSYGALKRGHTFLFSTGEIFCQKLLYHIVVMIVLKRFCILTHCWASSFFIKTSFCKTYIFYSLENRIWDKTKYWFWKYIKKKGNVGKFSKFFLRQQLFAFKKFCMETRLPNISKSTNAKDSIKAILKSSYREFY